VLWGSDTLLRCMWPKYAFDFTLTSCTSRGLDLEDFLLFSVAYFATDIVFDPDPRFLTHHLLSIAAMGTTWMCAQLQGTFLMTAVVAEVGGVAFHLSKMIQRRWMTLTFLFVYSFTRLAVMPVFISWLVLGLMHEFRWLYLWASTGTACLVVINIRWCFMQWQRFFKSSARSRRHPTDGEAKTESSAVSSGSGDEVLARPGADSSADDASAVSESGSARLKSADDVVSGPPNSRCVDPEPRLVPYSEYHQHKTVTRQLSEHLSLVWDILS
jgi:hypothetical protein